MNCKPTILSQKPRQILLFNKANWEAIRSGLISFYQDLCNTDINTLWTHFRDTLIDLTAKYIPSKTARKRCSLPWINAKLRGNAIGCFQNINYCEHYKSLKHTIQKEIRKSHQQYINTLISTENENDTYSHSNKKLWSYIKNLRKIMLVFHLSV